MRKILLIEDDCKLREQIRGVLEGYQYEVAVVMDFKLVEEVFHETKPDIVLLDINLPYYDGNYYCRMFRRASRIPIIIISARNSDMDQILSMELGADEYIVKPFHIQLLLAKVNAVIRRTYGEYAAMDNIKEWSLKGLSLDADSFKLSYENKVEELSKNEFKLLKQLMENPGKVITREELLAEIWDDCTFVDDNTLSVNIARIKLKLNALGLLDVIKTKRGVGYYLDIV